VVPKPMPVAPRRYLILVPRLVLRGAARCALQVLGRVAQAVARVAARCLSQVLDRGVQVAARDAATLSQQEKGNSADAQRSRINSTFFLFTVASSPSRRCTFDEFKSLAVALWRR
jgi:hypothetical protein